MADSVSGRKALAARLDCPARTDSLQRIYFRQPAPLDFSNDGIDQIPIVVPVRQLPALVLARAHRPFRVVASVLDAFHHLGLIILI